MAVRICWLRGGWERGGSPLRDPRPVGQVLGAQSPVRGHSVGQVAPGYSSPGHCATGIGESVQCVCVCVGGTGGDPNEGPPSRARGLLSP